MSKDIKEMLKSEKAKKTIVFASLGVLFAASMYLIFAPSGKDKAKVESGSGINAIVPQATTDNLTDDKLKAYEFDTEEKDLEREKAIGTLSEQNGTQIPTRESEAIGASEDTGDSHIDRSVHSYMETSDALTNFYNSDYDAEKEEMREEIERLNQSIKEMQEIGNDEEEQLALLEKSYQMASKYLPANGNFGQSSQNNTPKAESEDDKPVLEVVPEHKSVVSSLMQQKSDAEFMQEYSVERNMGFNTPTAKAADGMKNTIACKVDKTTTVKDNETLQLRLMESVRIGDAHIPKNSLLTARSKLSGNRMMLHVYSIEVGENIYPVKLTAYDMDGLEGVPVPGSDELDAIKEIGADIGGTMGTSFTFSSSAKDQIIADAAKGLMQGTSNYIVKKIRTVKVTFKGGHRLMLMPSK